MEQVKTKRTMSNDDFNREIFVPIEKAISKNKELITNLENSYTSSFVIKQFIYSQMRYSVCRRRIVNEFFRLYAEKKECFENSYIYVSGYPLNSAFEAIEAYDMKMKSFDLEKRFEGLGLGEDEVFKITQKIQASHQRKLIKSLYELTRSVVTDFTEGALRNRK